MKSAQAFFFGGGKGSYPRSGIERKNPSLGKKRWERFIKVGLIDFDFCRVWKDHLGFHYSSFFHFWPFLFRSETQQGFWPLLFSHLEAWLRI